MRTIERTGQFKRDCKREAKGQYRATLKPDLVEIVKALADDQSLVDRHRAHALTGDWKGATNTTSPRASAAPSSRPRRSELPSASIRTSSSGFAIAFAAGS